MNLSDLYEITTLTSNYLMLPKLGEIVSTFKLSVTILTVYLDQCTKDIQCETADLINFHMGQLAMLEIAPFLRGFCGDFVHGVEQLAGTILSQSPSKTAKTSEFNSNKLFHLV